MRRPSASTTSMPRPATAVGNSAWIWRCRMRVVAVPWRTRAEMGVEVGQLRLGAAQRGRRVGAAAGDQRRQDLGDGEARRQAVEEGRAVGRDQHRLRRQLGQRRHLAVGDGDDRDPALGGIARGLHRGPGVGRHADGQQHVLRRRRADRVGAGGAGGIQQHGALAQQRQHVVQMPGDRVAGAQAQAVDPAGSGQPGGGGGEAVQRRRLGQPGDMAGDGGGDLRRQRPVALQRLAGQLGIGPAGEAEIARPHRLGIQRPDQIVAVEAQALGQPGHRRRRHPGLARLLAHRQQGDVARPVQHVAGRRPQLRRHGLEAVDDALGEGALIHRSNDRQALQGVQQVFQY